MALLLALLLTMLQTLPATTPRTIGFVEPPPVAETSKIWLYSTVAGTGLTVRVCLALNLAIRVASEFISTVQGEIPPVHEGPLSCGGIEPVHPSKVEFGSGVTVSVAELNFISQLAVQKMPLWLVGLLSEKVTVPDPAPAKTMLRVLAAAVYGPTYGPPVPTGAAPDGWTGSVPVSARALAMLTRPLPNMAALFGSSAVPIASAERARRPTITPFDKVGSTAFMEPATPAMIAEEAEVPLM